MTVLKKFDDDTQDWETIVVGKQGPTGPTGATGAAGPVGTGVPAGGTTGQTIVKTSNTDYDTAWDTLTAADVGAYADDNPSNFIDAAGAPVQSVNGAAGTVVLDYEDVGAIGTAVGLYVFDYGTAIPDVRPASAAVYWRGTAEPGTALAEAGDLWYDADGD